jgi:hypothetical protein
MAAEVDGPSIGELILNESKSKNAGDAIGIVEAFRQRLGQHQPPRRRESTSAAIP